MSILDRRTLVAGLAAAVPAAAIGAAPALASEDAELIALGARLEEMLPRYFKARAEGRTGEAAAGDNVNALEFAMIDIAEAIVDSPASSLGGLAG